MTLNDIERVLNLLNTNQPQKALQELTDLRQAEILKQTNKKGAKLFEVAKAYLKRHEEDHPLLSKLQTATDNKCFVVDGFTAIKFLKDRPELATLPKASASESIGDAIFADNTYNFDKITDDELLILRNIPKYFKLYKHNVDNHTLIYMFNRFIEVKLLMDVMKFINTDDYNTILTTPTKGEYSAIHLIVDDNMQCVVLPMRLNRETDKERVKTDTNEFIKLLKKSKKV